MRRLRHGVPVYRLNIYTTDAIVDPYPHYANMRRLGPVVWLSKHRVYALPRFTECKAVLRDDRTFTSEKGGGTERVHQSSVAGDDAGQ